jgi:hypothetical protein
MQNNIAPDGAPQEITASTGRLCRVSALLFSGRDLHDFVQLLCQLARQPSPKCLG